MSCDWHGFVGCPDCGQDCEVWLYTDEPYPARCECGCYFEATYVERVDVVKADSTLDEGE